MALYVSGITEKDPLSYHCGETIRFSVTLTDGNGPVPCQYFQWHLRGDDGQVSDGSFPGDTGTCVIETALSAPGFVQLTVQAYSYLGEPMVGCTQFNGGAGADVEALTAGMPEPEDFDDFWQGVLAVLAEIPAETVEMKEIPSTNEACRVYDVKIYAGDPEKLGGTSANRFGYPASGYVAIPKDVDEGKTYPIRVHFMGYSFTGATPAEDATAITCLFNPHGLENGLPQDQYDRIAVETVGAFGFNNVRNRLPETAYFKGIIMRNVQAVRWVQSLTGWNGRDLVLYGGSMGAFQACSATALLPEVTELYLDIPWMCDLGGILQGRLRGWRPDVEENGESIEGIRYYDTTHFAARVTCPVRITAGLGDYCCPPSTVAVLYSRFRTEKQIVWSQNRTHGYTAPDAEIYCRNQEREHE